RRVRMLRVGRLTTVAALFAAACQSSSGAQVDARVAIRRGEVDRPSQPRIMTPPPSVAQLDQWSSSDFVVLRWALFLLQKD
ncbi:MAG TPA: hypothetical protein VGY54_02870, partial [Polyangiaceae bacterium]|nr:hypothetical protein [Polyangiaceae bacterium]